MTAAKSVRIWWDTSVQAYQMTSPFNAELVDAIKAFIPVSDRSYDRQSKTWTFVERQFLPLQNLFKTLNIQPTVVTRQQVEAQQQQNSQQNSQQTGHTDIDTVILQFFKLCPVDAMLKAYRAAAMSLHPDLGGDPDKMSELNMTWTRLQKEFYDVR